MKNFHLSVLGILLLLAGCATINPSMIHGGGMQHGNGMMQAGGIMDGHQTQGSGFLPAQGEDISSLPEAKSSSMLDVQDGQTITLNPTLVRNAIQGNEIVMYGYNGQIPGPLLRVKQGTTFHVNVTNNIDLPTSIHWHGLRLDNANDGAVGVTQKEIAPSKSFTYTIKVPDEGFYWYHSHVREDMQQPMGLYGGILVTPRISPTIAVEEHVPLILNDLLLDEDGKPVPYGTERPDHTLMGRFGNTFFVNGQTPEDIALTPGHALRIPILNASNTRTYRIIQPEGTLLKVVGGDSGPYEKQFMTESYTLSPSERVIVELFYPPAQKNEGKKPFIIAGDLRDPQTVISLTLSYEKIPNDAAERERSFRDLRTSTETVKSIDPFRSSFNDQPKHTLMFDLSMMGGMMQGHGMQMGDVSPDGIEWDDVQGMNQMEGMMTWRLVDKETGKANDQLSYEWKKGDKVAIRLINPSDGPHPMQHPIHFHGNRFLVLRENGQDNEHLVWKDTVLVPAGHTIDILLDASNPGDWMIHCHIAEHLGSGMMGMYRVR